MSASFPQTTRALNADRAGRLLGWIAPLLLLLGEWLAWFTLARIPVTETAVSARVHSESEAVALFSPTILGRVHPGHPAWLQVDAAIAPPDGRRAAIVTAVSYDAAGDRARVQLSLSSPTTATAALPPGLPGTAVIEIERVTPATLVLRAAGRR